MCKKIRPLLGWLGLVRLPHPLGHMKDGAGGESDQVAPSISICVGWLKRWAKPDPALDTDRRIKSDVIPGDVLLATLQLDPWA